MGEEYTSNPYESFRVFSEMWEKRLNDLLIKSIDQRELTMLTQLGVTAHSRYIERMKRNQELIANMINIPTKKDVANVAKLTVQAEEKLDILQQQIWELQDAFTLAFREQNKLFKEFMEFNQNLQTEWDKSKKELIEVKKINTEVKKLRQELADYQGTKTIVEELKTELTQLKEIKSEVAQFKEMVRMENQKKPLVTAE
ncbi:hypothetical protein M3181_09335 [Mesobacillus maritimus]|uniref:hypothetical protein n=1 Tax=Mesobacillus maritimus TaxID=1643336 RepID=UPI0020417615|nr:hypothetical protein [Mesobacillus maritimus]MCM3669204.1 hypothetical protein [Mesobacillus maritimus]